MAREPELEVQNETPEARALRIELHNHFWQVSQGHSYRCMFCGKESLAILWGPDSRGVPGNKCPKCQRDYDPILAADGEE